MAKTINEVDGRTGAGVYFYGIVGEACARLGTVDHPNRALMIVPVIWDRDLTLLLNR